MNFTTFTQTTKFQIGSIATTFLLITAMLTWQYKQSYYAEKAFSVKEISNIEKRLASEVTVGLHINNFPEFSFYKNNFVMDAFVWFQFPVGTESLNTIENFEFQNGKMKYKSKPIVQLNDKTVIISYHVVVKFITYLDYSYFPLSDHKLNIILENRSATSSELFFKSDQNCLSLNNNLLVTNWTAKKTSVKSGALQPQAYGNLALLTINYPCTVFTIDFENKSLSTFILLFFPLLLIFLVGFFSLFFPLTEPNRLSLIGATIPILVLYKLVINDLAPLTGSITKVDEVYFLLIFLSLLILTFQSYVILSVKKLKLIQSPEEQKIKTNLLHIKNNFTIVIIQIFLLIFFLYSTFL